MSTFLHHLRRNLQLFKRSVHLQASRSEVDKFNVKIPIEKAVTPPSSWFTTQLFHELDKVKKAPIDGLVCLMDLPTF